MKISARCQGAPQNSAISSTSAHQGQLLSLSASLPLSPPRCDSSSLFPHPPAHLHLILSVSIFGFVSSPCLPLSLSGFLSFSSFPSLYSHCSLHFFSITSITQCLQSHTLEYLFRSLLASQD